MAEKKFKTTKITPNKAEHEFVRDPKEPDKLRCKRCAAWVKGGQTHLIDKPCTGLLN